MSIILHIYTDSILALTLHYVQTRHEGLRKENIYKIILRLSYRVKVITLRSQSALIPQQCGHDCNFSIY